MRSHLISASLAAATALFALAASAGCAHDTARDVRTTSAPVQIAPPAQDHTRPPPAALPQEGSSREHGAAPVEEDGAPPAPGLGSTTHPRGQYGNGTSGTSSDTHKGTWRGGEQGLDPKPRPPDPTP